MRWVHSPAPGRSPHSSGSPHTSCGWAEARRGWVRGGRGEAGRGIVAEGPELAAAGRGERLRRKQALVERPAQAGDARREVDRGADDREVEPGLRGGGGVA